MITPALPYVSLPAFSFVAFCILLHNLRFEREDVISLWAQSFRTVLLWGHKKKTKSLICRWFVLLLVTSETDGIFHPASLWMFPAASGLSSPPGGGCRKGERKERTGPEGENRTWNSLLETFSVSGTWSDQLPKSLTQPLDRGMLFHFIDEETKPQFSLTQQVAHSYQVAWCSYGTETQGSLIRGGAFHDLTLPPSIPSSSLSSFPSSLSPSFFPLFVVLRQIVIPLKQ